MLKVLWVTERSERHQQRALAAAPPTLAVTMLANPTPDQLHTALHEAEVLVSERRGHLTTELFDHAPHLQLVVRLGALAHDIDLVAAQQRGIAVTRQADIGNQFVAEHCLMVMLALFKHLAPAQYSALHTPPQPAQPTDANTFSYNWAKLSHVGGLYERTVSILGMGDIGVELARRLKPHVPAQVLYHKRTPYPPAVEAELGITYATLDACLAAADVVVCLLPYTPATINLLDAPRLGQMQTGALLVQAGSGGTVDEEAVLAALASGHLGGAAFDTLTEEPLTANHPLRTALSKPSANLILTPHIAAGTDLHILKRGYEYAEIMRWQQGESLRYRLV